RVIAHWKAKGLDFSKLFYKPDAPRDVKIFKCEPQDHKIHNILDRQLIAESQPALNRGASVRIVTAIKNTNRAVGAMLSGEIAKRYGHAGLPDDTIHVKLTGTAGQSFGAWLARGVTLELEGEGNDYVGKGLSGGRIIVRPPINSGVTPEYSIVVGNTVLYGAISGECYFRGIAGERFAVRNSGAIAVVEGAGDHCCEYMTGGIVVVLGNTGRNFAAGMSGGIAYVLDQDGAFPTLCNLAMVELEPLLEEEIDATAYHQAGDLDGRIDIMSDLTRYDAARLHLLISRHARFAGSRRAAQIIANWNAFLPKFRKVMPVEYRRALAELAKEKAAKMEAAEQSRAAAARLARRVDLTGHAGTSLPCRPDGAQRNSGMACSPRDALILDCWTATRIRGLDRMGKVTGFLEFERNDRDYEPVEARVRHWREFVLPLPEAETRQQAARCMNCGIPYCHTG